MKPRFSDRIKITHSYTPAEETDIRKTFKKERERLTGSRRRSDMDLKTIPLKRRTA